MNNFITNFGYLFYFWFNIFVYSKYARYCWTNYAEVTNNMKSSIMNALDELSKKSSEELRNERYDKFRKMGRFVEV